MLNYKHQTLTGVDRLLARKVYAAQIRAIDRRACARCAERIASRITSSGIHISAGDLSSQTGRR